MKPRWVVPAGLDTATARADRVPRRYLSMLRAEQRAG